MLSDENRLAAPLPPPALRIVVARFRFVDFDRERIKSNEAGVDDRPLLPQTRKGDASRTGCCQ
jgi:hypothetical protein